MKESEQIIEDIHRIREQILFDSNNDMNVLNEKANRIGELFKEGKFVEAVRLANTKEDTQHLH
ncbi:MAG: hypothetical protein U0Y96_11450 [Candidatus Kapaibacterium sp.]|nr:hypothetical protein [Bacteroidota bacterium]